MRYIINTPEELIKALEIRKDQVPPAITQTGKNINNSFIQGIDEAIFYIKEYAQTVAEQAAAPAEELKITPASYVVLPAPNHTERIKATLAKVDARKESKRARSIGQYDNGYAAGLEEAGNAIRSLLAEVEAPAPAPAPAPMSAAQLLVKLGIDIYHIDTGSFSTAVADDETVEFEGKTVLDYLAQGRAEILAAGLNWGAGTVIEPRRVHLFSYETQPNTYGHPKAEFSAFVNDDGQWIVSRTGAVREMQASQ